MLILIAGTVCVSVTMTGKNYDTREICSRYLIAGTVCVSVLL